jgi:hypothetical protein
MSYTPLKINTLSGLLLGSGFYINPEAVSYMGSSTSISQYVSGSVVSGTVLDKLTQAIRLAYEKIGSSSPEYNALLNIGRTTIPALGNTVPPTYNSAFSGQTASYGFLRLIALQANNEFNIGGYPKFVSTFMTCNGRRSQVNDAIQAMSAATTFLDGTYSTMSDLITGDIAGVNLSTFYWGQDLIRVGRALDLAYIDRFGEPVTLLKTLSNNRAITKALNLVLLSAGFNASTLDQMINTVSATVEQQKLLYGSFSVIQGSDLQDILIPLNCQIPNLNTLADLLDPKKLFPNSFGSLSYPIYNAITLPTNSKTYHLIYSGGEPSINVGATFANRLNTILPSDLAFAAGAFSYTMMQIKRIKQMDIQKFAQVVQNLENTTDLDNINGTSIPTNVALVNQALPLLAGGTGVDGTFSMLDYFGAMTNIHYPWGELEAKIKNLQTSALATVYNNIVTLLSGSGPYADIVNVLAPQANSIIQGILLSRPQDANSLNSTYNTFGEYLTKEQAARAAALPADINDIAADSGDIIGFVQSLNGFATDTTDGGVAMVLNQISDRTTVAGSSLIAAMREERNRERMGLTGAEQDNNIIGQNSKPLPRPTNKTLNDLPLKGDFCVTQNPAITNLPLATGASPIPGSFGGSSENTLVPTNLSVLVCPNAESTVSPDRATEIVVLCNCDCWNNL